MRILLVQPPINKNVIGAGIFYLSEPLALETIAAAVPEHEVKILDMRLDADLEGELAAFGPEIVGVTAYTPDVYNAVRVLRQVKDYNRDTLTVVGGHHASALPEDFAKDCVDVIVMGQGEHVFREMVRRRVRGDTLLGIAGTSVREGNGRVMAAKKPAAPGLDATPLPARALTARYRPNYFRGSWRPYASMMTSRGCSHRCNFCSVWKREDGKYRTRSPMRVAEELRGIEEKYVSISDDNFLQDARHAEAVVDLIKDLSIKKRYKLIARADGIARHPKLIKKWREAGMDMMFVGLESFRDEELTALGKGSSVRDNEEAIRILRGEGVTASAHFIIDPGYGKEDFQALADYVEKMELRQPVFCILTPLPGTDLFEEKKSELLTTNYELFDLIHCVLPTKLPRREFCHHYAELYRRFYLESPQGGEEESFVPPEIMEKIIGKIRDAYQL